MDVILPHKVWKANMFHLDSFDIPTKCVSSRVTLDINACVQYIDFEGRSDGDAVRRYLTSIKPRQLVQLFAYCQSAS